MKVWTVHWRDPEAGGRGREAMPILVHEGFCWAAFLFAPVWLLLRGAFLSGIVVILLLVADALAVPSPFAPWLGFALFLVVGLFGTDLLRGELSRRGRPMREVVVARDRDAAWQRVFDLVPALQPAPAVSISGRPGEPPAVTP